MLREIPQTENGIIPQRQHLPSRSNKFVITGDIHYLCIMDEHRHITLSELQQQVKQTLGERFPLPVWVSAEISEIKVNYSGHCYLELVEKGLADGIPQAQARAVIWRTKYAQLAGYFEAETGQRLAAGLKVLARVLVNYHELYGFSLQIVDLDAAYTLGDMERRRQQTIAQLQQEGVWEMNRESALPSVVQRIAVISSRNAAGYQDFCKELDKSPYAFRLTLFDAFMQGAAAEDSIVEALQRISDCAEPFDAVVVIRGGGSASDLNCFNAYRLCAHIAQFPLPVITGIGHDKDTSVADMVAHTALKTPTAVAVWLVERMEQADAWLDRAALQLHDTTASLSHACELHLERISSELHSLTTALLARRHFQLETVETSLPRVAAQLFARHAARLASVDELVESHSPERVMRLGFSIARLNGKTVTSIGQVTPGDWIDLEVSDGHIHTTVEQGRKR